MKPTFEQVLISGRVVKTQTFVTERAMYRIDLIVYNGKAYFYKYKDGELVECCELI